MKKTEFDPTRFFTDTKGASQTVTSQIVEVKARVEMLQDVTNQCLEEQKDGLMVELDLSWRMVSFLEGQVMGLNDPSGELKALIDQVTEAFLECKKQTKEMETVKRKMQRAAKSPVAERKPAIRSTVSGPGGKTDVRAHFAALEKEREMQARLEFERKRRKSRGEKDLKRRENMPNAEFVDAYTSPPSRPTSLSRSASASRSDSSLLAPPRDNSAAMRGGSRSGSTSPEKRSWQFSSGEVDESVLASFSRVKSLDQRQQAPGSAPGTLGRSSMKRGGGKDIPALSIRFGVHRSNSDASSANLQSLLSPSASPQVSPTSKHLEKTLSSPLSVRKRVSVAFELGEAGVRALMSALRVGGGEYFLDQCQESASFTYALVDAARREQVAWASMARGVEETLCVYNVHEHLVWQGAFSKVFLNRSFSDDNMTERQYEWMEDDDEWTLPKQVVSSLLVRVALCMRRKPLPRRPDKPLPPKPLQLSPPEPPAKTHLRASRKYSASETRPSRGSSVSEWDDE